MCITSERLEYVAEVQVPSRKSFAFRGEKYSHYGLDTHIVDAMYAALANKYWLPSKFPTRERTLFLCSWHIRNRFSTYRRRVMVRLYPRSEMASKHRKLITIRLFFPVEPLKVSVQKHKGSSIGDAYSFGSDNKRQSHSYSCLG